MRSRIQRPVAVGRGKVVRDGQGRRLTPTSIQTTGDHPFLDGGGKDEIERLSLLIVRRCQRRGARGWPLLTHACLRFLCEKARLTLLWLEELLMGGMLVIVRGKRRETRRYAVTDRFIRHWASHTSGSLR